MTRPANNTPRLLLRPSEAAEILGVSLRCLMAWVAAGEVPAVRLGERCLRFSVDALRAWVASRSTWPTALTGVGSAQQGETAGITGANGHGDASGAAKRGAADA
jgi:excisionase family DNA binding protein